MHRTCSLRELVQSSSEGEGETWGGRGKEERDKERKQGKVGESCLIEYSIVSSECAAMLGTGTALRSIDMPELHCTEQGCSRHHRCIDNLTPKIIHTTTE
jgi:hypothetical protein